MKSNRSFVFHLLPTLVAVGVATARTTDTPLVEESIMNCLKIVRDPDGYTNVRAGADLDAKIAGKVLSGGAVFVDPEPQSGFHLVFLDQEDGLTERYLHGSRLQSVKDWKAVGPKGASGRLNHQGLEVVVKDPAFVASEHKITTGADGMVRVNGKSPWGQDGGEPNRSLTLGVSFGGKAAEVPAEATDNLYEPNLETLVLQTPGDPAAHAILMMANSDGAGGYYVVWAFEKGVYRGRAVMMP